MVQFNIITSSISDSNNVDIIGKALKTPPSLSSSSITSSITSSLSSALSSLIPSSSPLTAWIDMKILIGVLLIIPLAILSPQSKKLINGHPWFYRLLWVGAFMINLYTVSLPGRFDSQAAASSKSSSTSGFPWNTVFAPAGWAFAIWGVIYLGETIVTAYVGLLGRPFDYIRKSTPYFVAGNLFQSIWCFAFRPKFKQSLWLPMSLLAAGAASLFYCHNELTKGIDALWLPDLFALNMSLSRFLTFENLWKKLILLVVRFPISLHATWLTAASLLNLNAWGAVSNISVGDQVALGFFSAYFATIAGALLSFKQGDPFIAITVAWALAALAAQTKNRCQVDLPIDTIDALARTVLL